MPKKNFSRLMLFTLILLAGMFGMKQWAHARYVPAVLEVAVTVDGLPAHAHLPSGMTRLDVANQFITVFKKHHIPGTYGMVIASKIAENKDGYAVLQQWVKSGNFLGNHTVTHPDLYVTDAKTYIAEIEKTQSIIDKIAPKNQPRVFRYPFLSIGDTQKKYDTVHQYLMKNHYQVAPVTIDFADYDWNNPYARCRQQQNNTALDWLRKMYLQEAMAALGYAQQQAQKWHHRDIKYVLLLHIGAFDASMLDQLLTEYEKHGVKFIPLMEALKDPVYQEPVIIDTLPSTPSKKVKEGRFVFTLHETMDKLEKLCR